MVLTEEKLRIRFDLPARIIKHKGAMSRKKMIQELTGEMNRLTLDEAEGSIKAALALSPENKLRITEVGGELSSENPSKEVKDMNIEKMIDKFFSTIKDLQQGEYADGVPTKLIKDKMGIHDVSSYNWKKITKGALERFPELTIKGERARTRYFMDNVMPKPAVEVQGVEEKLKNRIEGEIKDISESISESTRISALALLDALEKDENAREAKIAEIQKGLNSIKEMIETLKSAFDL